MNNTATLSPASQAQSSSPALNYALWAAQILMALAFGMAGFMKTTTPIAELATKMPWVKDAPGLVRFIGVSEIAGCLGLLLPAATRIRPGLTSLAALGLAVIMVLATAFHVSLGELHALPITLGFLALCVFIAWGRFYKAPIAPRS